MRHGRAWTGAALALAIAGVPAAADTRAGYDAWSRGAFRQAVDLWRPEAIRGDADAQFDLGTAYKLGRGVTLDLAMAESWFAKAAAQGHQQAIDSLGLTLFQEGKREEAAPWLERSAARGEPRAQMLLGTMLFNGDGGLKRDYPRAYALLTRASGAGLPQAGQTLAEMDKYISETDRGRGLALARQMQADQGTPQLPPELAAPAGHGSEPRRGIQVADVPPSDDAPGRPAPPAPAPDRPPHRSHPMEPAPAPTPARTAAPPGRTPAAKGIPADGWRVQFGAFRNDGNARSLWETIKSRVPAAARLQPYLVHAGALTKLQAGPFASIGDATRACAAVRPTGTPCVPIKP